MSASEPSSGGQASSILGNGPLYAFSLPAELLEVIQLRSPLGTAASEKQQENDNAVENGGSDGEEYVNRPEGSALRCSLCGIARFESITEQRTHFSSDWHRYNIKRSLASKDSVKEQEWETMIDGLSDSISGTASSSDEDDSEVDTGDNNNVTRLLAKQELAEDGSTADPEGTDEAASFMSVKSPLLWFEAPQYVKDTQFGIYRSIFPSATKSTSPDSWLQGLKDLQVAVDSSRLGKRAAAKTEGLPTDPASRKWTLLAVGGGHFAGAVVSLVPQLSNRNGRIEREVVLLASKTFHRYTTRRKQGGAQSANDNAKSKAKSAGAQIRRHNEAMLTSEIRELLTSWKTDIDGSEAIFLRAGKTSHRIFYDYDGAVLARRDPRIRGFPFPTRRPTQAELVRCFTELTRVKLTHHTEQELADLQAAYIAAIEAKKPAVPVQPKPAAPKPEVPKLTKEELLERDRWERVLDMVRRDKVDALRGFMEKQGEEIASTATKWIGSLPEWLPERRTLPTLLHFASHNDCPEVVRYLLIDLKADPTVTSLPDLPEDDPSPAAKRRTPYDCAASRSVRDVFRKAYAEHPDWWNWEEDAKVPSKLTEEMALAQGAKKSERKGKLKDKLKERAAEREQERLAEEAKRKQANAEEARQAEQKRLSTPVSGPQRLGGGPPGMRAPPNALGGLSEEARRRIERERRVRAAEARAGSRQE